MTGRIWRLKPQQSKKAVFAFGEGQTEAAFLKFIRSQFTRNCGVSVKVDYAGGKDPTYIINKGISIKKEGLYDSAFILMDTDKVCPTEIIQRASDNGFNEILGSIPCIEGFFLSILEADFNSNSKDSKFCKKYFEDNYEKKLRDKLIPENYSRIFNKEMLEQRRTSVPQLDKIILYMTS